jgi:hypothetical protein
MAPSDQDLSEFKELTAMVEGTNTPGEIIEIDPTKAISKASRTPLAWLLALIVSFFSEYYKGNYDTKLSVGGTVQKPSPDAVPMTLEDAISMSLEELISSHAKIYACVKA